MKLTMTQKREYERPRMNVVELKHRTRLLVGSGEEGSKSSVNVRYTEEDI